MVRYKLVTSTSANLIIPFLVQEILFTRSAEPLHGKYNRLQPNLINKLFFARETVVIWSILLDDCTINLIYRRFSLFSSRQF